MKNLKGRLFRWSLLLSMHEYNIKCTKGFSIEYDMLSRDSIENSNNECVETNVGNQVSHLLQLDEIQEAKKNDNFTGKFNEMLITLCFLKRKALPKLLYHSLQDINYS